MQPKPQPGTTPQIDPRLMEVATRRALELRRQAIDDALRRLGRWLSRPFFARPKTVTRVQPCHS